MLVLRTIDYVLDKYNYINNIDLIDTPIYVRDYYRSKKELLSTKSKLQYLVDSVVGIKDRLINIIKLKDKKSIELQLKENRDLVTSNSYLIATLNLQDTKEIGSIVEIRFIKQLGIDTPSIRETFVRTDKTKANNLSVYINIINTIAGTPNSLTRHNVVEQYNLIRLKLNKTILRITSKGRVILDIGVGNSQLVSNYSANPNVIYLLLKLNARKYRSMFRRL